GRGAVAIGAGDGRARLEVWNSGEPIPADMLDEIFKRGLTTKSSGEGLGLAIARELTQRMGGAIAAENAPGGGVRFRVEFPRIAPEH
ncbi:MAG: hypothetical protein GF355_00840, partial [Candidatus Eisenbacteria bacterium]|nr:hypothetical protein [Candidatus Eisenbacteria bacterium]